MGHYHSGCMYIWFVILCEYEISGGVDMSYDEAMDWVMWGCGCVPGKAWKNKFAI